MKPLALTCGLLIALSQAQRADQPTPQVVLAAEASWAGPDVLLPFLTSEDVAFRAAAIRALGRLEDPSLVPRMLPLVTGSTNEPEPAATTAIAQSLKGFDPSTNPELVSTVTARFVALANASDPSMAFQRMTPLGRLNYSNEQQAKDAEKALLRLLDVTARDIKYGDAR